MLSELDIELLDLTVQQKTFAEEWIVDFNGARAARDAGYSEKTAREQGSRLLANVNVQAYIQHLMEKRAERLELTQDMIVKELMAIAFSDIKDFYCDISGELLQPHELEDRASKSVHGFKSMKTTKFDGSGKQKGRTEEVIDEYRRHDKIKALELLGKHLGVFEKDNQQKQPINQNINVSWE